MPASLALAAKPELAERRPRGRVLAALVFACAASGALSQQTELDAARPSPEQAVEHGVAVVQCVREGERLYRAQAAIVDLGVAEPKREVILTVAHVLPAADAIQRDCVVLGERDQRYAIEALWVGGNAGHGQDWAVLLVHDRLQGATTRRFRPLAFADLPDLIEQRARVRLLHGGGQADCEMHQTKWLTRADVAAGVFAHSCSSWPGLSGSPLVLATDDATALVAIHLGDLVMRAAADESGEAEPLLSLARGMDAELAAVLDQAAALAAAAR